jgi:hypothetical protein
LHAPDPVRVRMRARARSSQCRHVFLPWTPLNLSRQLTVRKGGKTPDGNKATSFNRGGHAGTALVTFLSR